MGRVVLSPLAVAVTSGRCRLCMLTFGPAPLVLPVRFPAPTPPGPFLAPSVWSAATAALLCVGTVCGVKRLFSWLSRNDDSASADLVGWRRAGLVGLLDGGQIVQVAFESVNQSDLFGRRALAVCRTSHHTPPDPRCSCGFYALKERAPIRDGEHAGFAPRLSDVMLRVRLSGSVVEGERGLRASHQTVERVEMPALCTWGGCDRTPTRLYASSETAAINLSGRWVRLHPICGSCSPDRDAITLDLKRLPDLSGVADVALVEDFAPIPPKPPRRTSAPSPPAGLPKPAEDVFLSALAAATVVGAVLTFLLFGVADRRLSPSEAVSFDPVSLALPPLAGVFLASILGAWVFCRRRRLPWTSGLPTLVLSLASAGMGVVLLGASATDGFLRSGSGVFNAVMSVLMGVLVLVVAGFFVVVAVAVFLDAASPLVRSALPVCLGVVVLAAGFGVARLVTRADVHVGSLAEAEAAFEEVLRSEALPPWFGLLSSSAGAPGELAALSMDLPSGETLVEGYWLSADGAVCWVFPVDLETRSLGSLEKRSPVMIWNGRPKLNCGRNSLPAAEKLLEMLGGD